MNKIPMYKIEEIEPTHAFESNMERLAFFKPEDIIKIILECEKTGVKKCQINECNCNINIFSGRLKNFAVHGCVCVECNCIGVLFVLERHISHNPLLSNDTPHLNLYSVIDDVYVLMTKDHILPKSLGGKNIVSNYQPMCVHCNGKKGNDIDDICIYNLDNNKRSKSFDYAKELSRMASHILPTMTQNNFMTQKDLKNWTKEMDILVNKIQQYRKSVFQIITTSDIITSEEEFIKKEKEFVKKYIKEGI